MPMFDSPIHPPRRRVAPLTIVAVAIATALCVAAPAWSSELSTVAAWTLTHNTPGSDFGISVQAGDLDGDGDLDLIVGAPGFDNGDGTDGRVFVFINDRTAGSPPAFASEWSVASDQAGSGFGSSIAVGDLSGDGIPDLIVGAPTYSSGGAPRGAVHVYLGGVTPPTTPWTTIACDQAGACNQAGASSGAALAVADLDQDGKLDLVVGAPDYDTPATDGGEVFVYLNRRTTSGGLLVAGWSVSGTTAGPDAEAQEHFGASLAVVGDLDGDTFSDVAIGAPRYDGGTVDRGRILVFGGAVTGFTSGPRQTLTGDSLNERFGDALAAGDVSGDGHRDLVVGAPGAARALVYLWSAQPTPALYPQTDPSPSSSSATSRFGASVAVGDVNGDGFADAVIGAPLDGGNGSAAAYLGSASGLIPSSTPVWSAAGPESNAQFGAALAAGDVDGDGFADVIVGAPGSGRAYVYTGSCTTTTVYPDADHDGHGSATDSGTDVCAGAPPPAGYVTSHDDCDDTDASVHPGATEVCDPNDIDEDCNGVADDADPNAVGKTLLYADADGDGYGTGAPVQLCHGASVGGDCDDTNVAVHPGATEVVGDGIDEDCDGHEVCYVDADFDAYRTNATVTSADLDCTDPGEATAAQLLDCDDTHASAHPGGTEVCDAANVDEDCNGFADDDDPNGATGKTLFYVDADADGYGTGAGVLRCDGGPGYAPTNGDCDDTNASVHPGATEVVGDGIDEDCDGHEVCYQDADHDGFRTSATVLSADVDCTDPGEATAAQAFDCDDTNASAHPGATEVCDAANVDEDCDGFADDADPNGATGKTLFYVDADSDGYGTGAGVLRCHGAPGYAPTNGDCDDTNASVHPGATEVVGDGIDEDCDGHEICYQDADHDGYRANATVMSADLDCTDPGEGTAAEAIDCDDSNPSIGAGVCSLCSSGPLACKASGVTRLTIRNNSDDRHDQMQFTWGLGEETTAGDVGNPTLDTQYAVCVWDYVGGTPTLVMEMAAPPGGNCFGRPCWVPIGTDGGFRYNDFGLLPNGIQQLKVRTGRLGKARVSVKARGTELPDPPMPFQQNPLITVQVINSLGNCWGADYVSPARTNTGQKLMTKEKP
jgi:hypothetical protein